MDTYLYQYEFAGYGYNTYTAQGGKGLASASPLPYFILTSDRVIFFSEDLELYIAEENSERIAYMHEFFQSTLSSSVPFCYTMNTIDDFSLFTSLASRNAGLMPSHFYDLSSNLCLATLLDVEVFADAAPDTIEHKDYFMFGASSFFDVYRHTPHINIFENDSLIKFVENDNDICDYHNVTFDFLRISPKNKLKLLKRLRKLSADNISHHYITIPKLLKMPSFFHVNTYSSNLLLGFNFKILDVNDRQNYIAVTVSHDPVLNKHFQNLSEYIIHSSYVYSTSRNYAISQIDNAISYYCKKHGFADEL